MRTPNVRCRPHTFDFVPKSGVGSRATPIEFRLRELSSKHVLGARAFLFLFGSTLCLLSLRDSLHCILHPRQLSCILKPYLPTMRISCGSTLRLLGSIPLSFLQLTFDPSCCSPCTCRLRRRPSRSSSAMTPSTRPSPISLSSQH